MNQLELQIDGNIARLHLNNPRKLNCFTPAMLEALDQHCAEIEKHDQIRVVIISAEGEKAFCAGAEINAWAEIPATQFARHWVREGHRIFDRLARLSMPTIAVLNGHALGGGLELAATADLRIATHNVSLGLPENQIGIVPGWSGSQRLQRLLPEPIVKEMTLFGRRISAERGRELGFIAEVDEDPMQRAGELAQQVLEFAPVATQIAKIQIHAGAGEDGAAMIEALGGAAAASTNDKQLGVEAFLEKRKPKFEGN